MKKIMTVVGARPQFIKAAAVSGPLRERFDEVFVHTGQHYDANMSGLFFSELGIPQPDYNLKIGSASHAVQTAEMMIALEKLFISEKPDMALIYGDTNSTLAAALVASKLLVPTAHVEAGVRFGCPDMPEEQNRRCADCLSDLLLASTEIDAQNLKAENLKGEIRLVGDVMYDLLLASEAAADALTASEVESALVPLAAGKPIDLSDKSFYYATCHRAENTDERSRLDSILTALNSLSSPALFPAHPRIKSYVVNEAARYNNIYFVEPLGYLESVFCAKRARGVITDSGGLHKEAYLLGTPCVTVLRGGWTQTLKGGWNVFVSPDTQQIINAVNRPAPDASLARDEFGDGHAARRIVDCIEAFLNR